MREARPKESATQATRGEAARTTRQAAARRPVGKQSRLKISN